MRRDRARVTRRSSLPFSRATTTLALVAMGSGSLAACGRAATTPYQAAFAQAERAEVAGRYTEAASDFDRAAQVAPSAREQAHAAYASAEMLIRAGDLSTGAARLRAIANANPPGEHSAQAAYEIASLEIRDGDANGWNDLEKAMTRFPNDGLAHRALTRLAMHVEETSGQAATIGWLEKIAPSFTGTELEQAVAFETAKRIDASGDIADARARYIAIADKWPYPHGAFWDDSLYRAALVDEKNKKYEEAISDLERMLADRETASMLGSYERPMYEPAAWKIAEIYRDDLHDTEKAAAAFHRVYSEFTTSLKRDDALWEESLVWKKNGDASAACSSLSTLVSKFPDSRYVPCAVAKCSDISRPSKSQAPKECPAYLDRPRR